MCSAGGVGSEIGSEIIERREDRQREERIRLKVSLPRKCPICMGISPALSVCPPVGMVVFMRAPIDYLL